MSVLSSYSSRPRAIRNDATLRRRVEPAGRTSDSPSASSVPQLVHDVLRSPGQSLDHANQKFYGLRMGHDFSRVRVHTDSRSADSARSVGAAAYTFGGHLVFGEGKFQPGSADGRRLLAHELAHVIQQDESNITGVPEGLGEARDSAEEWAERQSRSALEGAPLEEPASTVAPQVQRQTDEQGVQDSPAAASPAAAVPGAGWSRSDPSVNFTISNQHLDASFLRAGGPALTGAGFGTWTNQRVFNILPPDQVWLRTDYQVDTIERPLPDKNLKFSVTNDIRFTTSSGQTTVDKHFQDDSPAYGGAGYILGTKLGFQASDRTLPILELPLNEGGVLTWRAGFILPGEDGVSFQAKDTIFRVQADKPAAPNPLVPGGEYGPERTPAQTADQPAGRGTPLPKSPGGPKVLPKDLAEVDALADAVREATEIAKKTFLLGKLRDKLAGLEPFGVPKADLTKLIDEALDSLAKEGVKAGLKAVLEAIAGTGATTMPDDRNPRGPNVPEGVPGQKTQSTPKIPLDYGTKPQPVLAFRYEKGLRSSYTAGEAMKFTVVLPEYLASLGPNPRLIIVPATEAKSANQGTPSRGPVPLKTSGSQQIILTAPAEPGKYVIRVDAGMGLADGSSIQEFEVTAAKK